MLEPTVVSESQVRALLDPSALRAALVVALVAYSQGRCSVPPRFAATAPRGILAAMPGYVPGIGLATKLVTVFPGNHDSGTPSHQALIALFDERDGSPLVVMDGTAITAIRTAATAAIAADILARDDSRVLTIIGAGVQGGAHLDCFASLRQWTEIRVASRNPMRAAELADRHPDARLVEDFETAIRDADVVCCCTDARDSVANHDWIGAGTHISSVGSGAEIDARTIASGRVFVEWRGAATNPAPAGAVELQHVDAGSLIELGELLAGTRPGREQQEEITIYKSTGLAVEDAAAARVVYDALVSARR